MMPDFTQTTGFPSPADDFLDPTLNLQQYVVRRPSSTFFIRMQGDNMAPGIPNGAILVVDRSLTPQPGNIIFAVVDGERLIRRCWRTQGGILLRADHPTVAPLHITDPDRFSVWGVVTFVVYQATA